jgi:solute carrier family 25 protein 39/40
MSVPMVGIYMPLYDYCMASWSKAGGAYTPILAGTFSRVVAVFSVAPFELIRTRQQVAHFTGSATGKLSVLEAAKLHSTAVHSDSSSKARMMLRQVRSLWTGVSATLLRDVPFSALYWGTVEPTRQALLPKGPGPVSKKDLVVSNMVAGGVCGCFAAGITTPFDVVKTRLQLGAGGPGKKANVWQVLRDIRQQQGLQGLFSGVGPRSVRAAPACALVISVYEVLKSVQLSIR